MILYKFNYISIRGYILNILTILAFSTIAIAFNACGSDEDDSGEIVATSIYNQWQSNDVSGVIGSSVSDYEEIVLDFTKGTKAVIYVKSISDGYWHVYLTEEIAVYEKTKSSGKIQLGLSQISYTIKGTIATFSINGNNISFRLTSGIEESEPIFINRIWQGNISQYYYDRWGVSGDHYRTVIEFVGNPLHWTKGTGYEVDYDANDPYGSFWYSGFNWRVDNGVITLVYADTDYEPVKIYSYRLNSNYLVGYMDDGTNDQIQFKFSMMLDFDWSKYSTYNPYYAHRKTASVSNDAPAPQKVRFANKGVEKMPKSAAE
jgi:hypothetical protein